MATYRNQNPNRKFYKINQYISAPEVRLIDEEAKQIGVMPIADARKKSFETGLDLVEIAPLAKPPVVKLIDFSKFKYQEAKKMKAEKRGIKGGELKEVQMTPFISQNDFDTNLKKAQKFLTSGNKVKLGIKFQGRQIQRKEFGYQLVERFKQALGESAAVESEPKLIGKRLFVTFTPVKVKKTINHETPQQETQN
ncbi:translation initiation factor IF-3 [Candidatus Shapirobacteria bacterium RBG_13_44_7]|uniref:Translation initiation factor IF-3 n=1 Tax=Candidatus Shapirobacteria bacterium RBG_13_44_7 TaxID=1802149 RepID=A0A1F7SMB7_9BACT|nr:MAG: translation initiation factor IF-3 [Candidatus Shapirobacteria bacterium RBG_13_44_7]